MSVQFNNISCRLGGREILKNLSGEVKPGQITAVLGPNGCGKSTFLRALLGLVLLEAGQVTGLSASRGYLPQKKEIYWPLTCEAIIGLGNQEPGTKNHEQIGKTMQRLNIERLRDKRIDEVSGGERTLVLLARALRDQPQVIFADEPVAELDPKYQTEVMRALKEEAARGAAVLVTMHDIQLTARFCDTVMLMQDGMIVKCGSPEENLTAESLADLFKIPFQTKAGFYAG